MMLAALCCVVLGMLAGENIAPQLQLLPSEPSRADSASICFPSAGAWRPR